MAKYTVVKAFRDFEDKLPNGEFHTYYDGDKYPRAGRVNEERAALLSSKKNKRGEILIKELKEETENVPDATIQKAMDELKDSTNDKPETEKKETEKAEETKAKKEAAK